MSLTPLLSPLLTFLPPKVSASKDLPALSYLDQLAVLSQVKPLVSRSDGKLGPQGLHGTSVGGHGYLLGTLVHPHPNCV